MKELTNNAMTKIMSAEIWLAVLISLAGTAFTVGATYAYVTKDVENNAKAVESIRRSMAANTEQTKRDIKEITSEVGEIKTLLAELAAVQKIQTEIQNERGQRQDKELQAIRQILETHK